LYEVCICFQDKNAYIGNIDTRLWVRSKNCEPKYIRRNYTMPTLNFDQLVSRYGELLAWQCLAEIERAARLRPQQEIADPEIRLANALRTQDDMILAA
jgi:hypothetical protein